LNDHPNFANRIRQMREDGLSLDEVISTLGVSWERSEVVRRIVRKFETETVLLARSNRFMEEIRNADDLDKKWKVSCLMQGLRPKVITQNAVIRHFEWPDRKEISLRQLMDLTISEQQHPRPGYLVTPLLEVRCVGLEGFWSLVRRLAESDLGERCNLEWSRRLLRLMQCSRIVGGQGSWSKPCEPPDWLLTETSATTLIRHLSDAHEQLQRARFLDGSRPLDVESCDPRPDRRR
jgi:hypothetical protein